MINEANESIDVFCRLTITTRPAFLFVFLGKSRQGRICNDVPKHKQRSACLIEKNSLLVRRNSAEKKPYAQCFSESFNAGSGSGSSQSRTVSRSFPRQRKFLFRPFDELQIFPVRFRQYEPTHVGRMI